MLTIQPVGSVALGMLILAETPSALQLLGVAAVVAGLLVVTVRRHATAPHPVPHAEPA